MLNHCSKNWLVCSPVARVASGGLRTMLALVAAWLMVLTSAPVQAQGLLVNTQSDQHFRLPRPQPPSQPAPLPSSYRIKELDVQVKLTEQAARVQVSQSFVNTGSQQMQVCFVFPLPYDGAIDQLTLMVDGKEIPGKLHAKDDARRIYEEIVRRNQDPALLEWLGTGMFQTSVFPVPAGAERKVSLRYTQLCRKQHGLTDFIFPLSTAKYTSQPVEKVNVQVVIDSKIDIKNVYSPSHSVTVKRDAHHATIQYQGANEIPANDFRLFYDVEAGQVGASVLSYRPNASDEGYFLLLASPQIKAVEAERPKKTVQFVVDRSGSMSGEKMEQAKAALKFVLNNLREGDLFNIIAYDSEVESFRPELQRFSDETRQQALAFAEGLYAGGSTNIDGALTTALKQLVDSSRPNYVLFMTDGLPTTGVTQEATIVANAKSNNQVRARLIVLGVGYDLNSRLLDRLARGNHGQSEFVRPNENVEAYVARLYQKIESPVMTDVAIDVSLDKVATDGATAVNRVYPREVVDLFEGEQLVLVGRYKHAGNAKITVRGSVGGQTQSIDFPAELVEKSTDDAQAFIEKLWAMRRVGEIIDELDLKGQNEELVKELVELSTRHGILTPYTSFLADETTRLEQLGVNLQRTNEALHSLDAIQGERGVAQRSFKGALKKADQASSASAPTAGPVAGGRSRRFSGLGAGGATTGPAPAAALVPGLATYRDAAKDEDVIVTNCRSVGTKAFFKRNGVWCDSTVTDEQIEKARKITQFSDEYFALAGTHGRRMSQYLVFDEPVVVSLEGDVIQIEPSAVITE